MKLTKIALALTAGLGLSACAQPNMDSRIYTPQSTMTAQHVNSGTIIGVRSVEVRSLQGNSDRVIGVVAGGLAGALVADKITKGNAIGTGAGAIAGAAGGDAIARNVNRVPAQEWTVRLDNGRTIAVVQNDIHLFVGQYVRVIYDGTRTRITY